MDPNQTLGEMRDLARKLQSTTSSSSRNYLAMEVRALRLAQLVQDLDKWMTGGGAMPSDWLTPISAVGRLLEK